MWRGDYQGLIGADIALEIPAIPINAQLFSMPIHQVMVMPGSVMTIPGMRLPFTSIVPFVVYYGPVELPQSTLTLPTVTITVGGPTTTIDGNLTGMVGGVSIPLIKIPAAPGFGNSTTSPSSGFFNAGAGTASGFGNFGGGASGFWNLASATSGLSGFGNVGALGSGVANVGNTISGLYNTSTSNLATPAFNSGLLHHAGLLHHSVGTMTLNFGLANVGGNNVGGANAGIFNVGLANLGDYNIGFGNLGGAI